MLTVTDNAKDYLKGLMNRTDMSEGVVLRLVASGEGLTLAPDVEKDDDTVYASQGGETILVVSEGLAQKLGGVTLDVQQTDEGPRLAVG